VGVLKVTIHDIILDGTKENYRYIEVIVNKSFTVYMYIKKSVYVKKTVDDYCNTELMNYEK
jgi:hypothetical protein